MSLILFLTFPGVVLVCNFPIFALLLFVCCCCFLFHTKEAKNGEMLRYLDVEKQIVTTKNPRADKRDIRN